MIEIRDFLYENLSNFSNGKFIEKSFTNHVFDTIYSFETKKAEILSLLQRANHWFRDAKMGHMKIESVVKKLNQKHVAFHSHVCGHHLKPFKAMFYWINVSLSVCVCVEALSISANRKFTTSTLWRKNQQHSNAKLLRDRRIVYGFAGACISVYVYMNYVCMEYVVICFVPFRLVFLFAWKIIQTNFSHQPAAWFCGFVNVCNILVKRMENACYTNIPLILPSYSMMSTVLHTCISNQCLKKKWNNIWIHIESFV